MKAYATKLIDLTESHAKKLPGSGRRREDERKTPSYHRRSG